MADINVLNMSDEELKNLDPATLVSAGAEQGAAAEVNQEDDTDPDGNGDDDNADQGDDHEQKADGDTDKEDGDAGENGKEEGTDGEDGEGKPAPARTADGKFAPAGKADPEKVDPAKPAAKSADGAPATAGQDGGKGAGDGKKEEVKPDTGTVNYQAEYERILAPFKANGRDMQVKSADEAIQLMQMGANYNKKMAALKPNLTLMKMLDNNGLLNAEKISFLIDLDKKNPEAINKLVKESGIDPLDLSAEKAGDYKPGNHSVDDAEVELDDVIADLKESPAFDRVLDVASKEWDRTSRAEIAKAPNILRVIDAHVNNGIYDLISDEVTRERTFGRLKGLSDLEAYRQVGDAMAAGGKFEHILKPAGQPAGNGQQTPAAPVVVVPNPKQADEDERKAKKKAAAPVKAAAPAGKLQGLNPLEMSDEDFAKFKPN